MSMKKLFMLLLLGLPVFARAQMAIIDVTPSKYIYQSKSLASQVQQLVESMKTTSNLVSMGQTLYKTQSIVSQTLNLQNQIKMDLLSVSRTRNFKWSDMNTLYSAAQGISLNYTGLIPKPNQGTPGQLLQNGNTSGNAAKTVFYSFNSRDQQALNEPAVIKNLQQSSSTRLQLDDASSIRKIQTADFYNKVADDLAAKSVDLSQAVNSDNQLSMTHAERLSILKQCSDLMMQSVDLRTKADMLRKEAVTPTAAQTEKIRQQRQELLYTGYRKMKTVNTF